MVLTESETALRDEVRALLATALAQDLRLAGRRVSSIFADHPDGIRWHQYLDDARPARQ